jgi:hypothetical protein
MSQSDQDFDVVRQPEPYKIVISKQGAELTGILGQAVKAFGLDSYETNLLTRRAGNTMKAFAVLLVVNFVFDLAAWWLLFNAVFSGGRGIFDLDWHSMAAMVFSLLISSAIFIYEQQFMTADISNRKSRFATPVMLRVGVIVAAAFITTQPVELMLFRGPIERRIHEESIRLEAITRLKDWQDALKKQGLEGVPSYYRDRQKDAEDKKQQEEQKLRDLNNELQSAEQRLAGARGTLRYVKTQYNNTPSDQPDRKNYWKSRIPGAEAAVAEWNGKVSSLNQDISNQQSNVDTSIKNAQIATGDVKDQVERAVKDEGRVRNWIAEVRQSKRGERLEDAGWTFQDQTYDFFDQLRVLRDMTEGRPTRWPEASQEDRDALAKTFHFMATAEEAAEAQQDAKFYSYAYWAVFGIAFVIPALLLAFKLLQPQELRDYYSREKQEGEQYDYIETEY